MEKIIRIGLDTSKHVFQVHGVNAEERVVLRRQLRRREMEAFFGSLASTTIGLEACGGAHYWARELTRLGHEVRLLPPNYVKPYVKRAKKNDARDAAAICEAAGRPSMRFVPVKSADQQAALMLHRVRDLLIKQRTMLVNAIRGHAAEFGIVAAQGIENVSTLLEQIRSGSVPELARDLIEVLAGQLTAVELRRRAVDKRLRAWFRQSAESRRLATIPGIGVIGATALVMKVPDPHAFRSGRHFAAWLGLTPREHSTAGRQRLGRISREGDKTLRTLLITGATTVVRLAKPGRASPWLLALLQRRPRRVAAVAWANKIARIAWALMISGQTYRRPQPA